VSANRVIGVDLGGTKILAGLVDAEANVLQRRERETPTDSQDALLAELETAIAEPFEEGVEAIGIGIPSRIDRSTGLVQGSVNIPLDDLDLRARLQERFGVAVALENDANVAALAEHRLGAGRGSQTMVMLTLGTGCGGGVVIDGRLYRGWAEFGHMVIQEDGLPCQGTCTGRGHLEPYVTGVAATKLAQEAFGPDADAHRLVRLADEGDARAREILAGIGRHLGAGIATLVNIFAPELVVIGGGFAAAGDFILEPAREVVRYQALEPISETVRIVPAELGTTAGLVGAGLLALEAV
jgi:glucokinase